MYFEFMFEFEYGVVNLVVVMISRRWLGFDLLEMMIEDVYKIYTDEVWHV